MGYQSSDPQAMVGQRLERFEGAKGDEVARLYFGGNNYEISHQQDCCERVDIYLVDMQNMIGKNIERVEFAVNNDLMPGQDPMESWTNSIFKFYGEGCEGLIHFLGQSNGYYGEGVDFYKRLGD